MRDDAGTFVVANTALGHAPLVPEIALHLGIEVTPIWQATETWLAARNVDPPFWAFAWPGGQALARHIIDNPAKVRGRRVLDFAAGCGIAAIACARAGAVSVEAAEIDPLAIGAIRLNAHANEVDTEHRGSPPPSPLPQGEGGLHGRVPPPLAGGGRGRGDAGGSDRLGSALTITAADLVGADCRWDLILCGDVCYEAPMTAHILPWLRAMAARAEVWVADPGRAYLPDSGLVPFARYVVPTTLELEDRTERSVTLYRLEGTQ